MERVGFRHEALIYAGAADFLAAAVPFIRGALEAGEPALVAVSRANTQLLEGKLGKDASQVRFADMEMVGLNPARIIPFWRDFLDENGSRPVRGIGEPVWPGRGSDEIDECQPRRRWSVGLPLGDIDPAAASCLVNAHHG